MGLRRLFRGRTAARRAAPALDTAAIAEAESLLESGPHRPNLMAEADLGRALRAIREYRGLTLEDVSHTTRVRRVYLEAIEGMQLERLPSRPFTIGYIRAYASALGQDADAAVARFKAEEPVLDEPLRPPIGVDEANDPRLSVLIAGAVFVVLAIALWNIAQRLIAENAPLPSTAPANMAAQPPRAKGAGPVVLGPPLPAPVESTIPPPYETPGLAAAAQGGRDAPQLASVHDKPSDHVPVDLASLPAVFVPEGRVFDSGKGFPSVVTLKALKPSALVIRGSDGAVYFARQMAAGEAYRAPRVAGLTVVADDNEAFQVFSEGRSRGVLPANQVLISKLEAPAAAPAPAGSARPLTP